MNKTKQITIIFCLIVMVGLIQPLKALGIAQHSNVEQGIKANTILTSFAASPPKINITTWSLRVDGQVQHPLNLTYDEIKTLPAVNVYSPIICVGGPTYVTRGNWTGVQLRYILSLIKVKPEAFDMVFYAADGFSSSLEVKEIVTRPDMLLAYEQDGQALNQTEGFPLKIIAPGKWGYKWVRWVEHIELVDRDYRGYWESAGYSDEADIPDYKVPLSVSPSSFKLDPYLLTYTVSRTTTPATTTSPDTTDIITTVVVPEFELSGLVTSIVLGVLLSIYKLRKHNDST